MSAIICNLWGCKTLFNQGLRVHLPIILLVYSSGSLLAAYIAQYVFDLQPCILCLYQRIPFFMIIPLALLSIILKGQIRLALIFLSGLSLLATGSIAAYHVGVEQGIFHMTDGCIDNSEKVSSVKEMTEQLLGKANVPCNQITFRLMGISMAAWNMLFSLFLGFYVVNASYKAFMIIYYVRRSEKYRARNQKLFTEEDNEEKKED